MSPINGHAALSKIFTELSELILTEFRMPALTGLDILPEIRKLHPNAAVIVITGVRREEIPRRWLKREASIYAQKANHFHELNTLIDEVPSPKRKIVLEVRNHSLE